MHGAHGAMQLCGIDDVNTLSLEMNLRDTRALIATARGKADPGRVESRRGGFRPGE
jgi:hypothetical protein